MSPHPGCKMILPEHLQMVQAALSKWKRTATLPPGFEGWNGEDAGKHDHILARLIWLEFWMRWALENCETPAIENT